MELGRECLEIWGYKRMDELIWVKTNMLQRLIRTGRTGHWLNHSKEHCLVGKKGNPSVNRCVDCDVLIAEYSKEGCLVGKKGNPLVNRCVDCDVLVAEARPALGYEVPRQVRETSRKPDEMYSMLERLSPGTRKIEIFARDHNLQPGWVGLGNQLNGSNILEPEMRERYMNRYGPIEEPVPNWVPPHGEQFGGKLCHDSTLRLDFERLVAADHLTFVEDLGFKLGIASGSVKAPFDSFHGRQGFVFTATFAL
eukprot:gene25819-11494_t